MAPLFPLIVIGMLLTTAGIYGTLCVRDHAAIPRTGRPRGSRQWTPAGAACRGIPCASVVGTMLGIAAMFGLARVVRASGGGGSIFDSPASAFVVPVIVIVVIGIVATWVPSLRAEN